MNAVMVSTTTGKTLSTDEILQRLKADKIFAVGFAVDNNYPAIAEKLADKGYVVNSPQEATQLLLNLASQGKGSDVIYALTVPYLNDAPNYTAGQKDYFITAPTQEMPPQNKSTNWAGWLTVIGSAIAGVGTGLSMSSGSGAGLPGAGETPAEKAKREADEAERKRKTRNQWLIGIGIGLVLVGILIYAFAPKKAKA